MSENNNEVFIVPSIEQVEQSLNPIVGEENLQVCAPASSVKPSEQPQPLKDNAQDVKDDDPQETLDESPKL